MELDRNTIERIANLARLEIKESEHDRILNDMNKIIGFMDKLNELDTSGVEPLIYMSEEKNVMRADVIKSEISAGDALLNAPDHDGRYFKVAKVIDKQAGSM